MGLIIQGSLIFLSAVVGVIGYLVQSKLRLKEEEKRLERDRKEKINLIKLNRVKEQLENYVAPVNSHLCTFMELYYGMFAPKQLSSEDIVRCTGNEREGNYGLSMDDMTDGGITKYYKSLNIHQLNAENDNYNIVFKYNLIPSFVGQEIEERIRKNPKSKIGKYYINNCKLMILNSGKKCAKIIENNAMVHLTLMDINTFAKKYEIIKRARLKRVTILYQFVHFIEEFEYIINNYWANDDYTILFPENKKFPTLIGIYATELLTILMRKEAELGTRDKANIARPDLDLTKLKKSKYAVTNEI